VRPATLARLAVAGNRTDVLRTVLTAISAGLAGLALLSAATVASIGGWAERYSNELLVEGGLRPGVVIALVLVAMPVLALAGQCIRLGAPARDRRLAAIRLAGATPGEAVLIATAETAVASLLGSLAGLLAWAAARRLLDRRDRIGRLILPTDVRPSTLAIVALVIIVPLLAALIGAVLMRRVIVTPLGVVRRTRDHAPRPWPGLLIAVGLGLFWVLQPLSDESHLPTALTEFVRHHFVHLPRLALYICLGAGLACMIVGVVLGTGWISYTAGRLLRRYGRGPATLLAGKQLLADPWSGSRTLAALLAAVIAGAVALGYRSYLATQFLAYDRLNALNPDPEGGGTIGAGAEPSFYFNAIRLVMITVALATAVAAAGILVTMVESIVARRRAYAAMTATGVPRRTLAATVLWHTLTPLVPALVIALVSGVTLVRLTGTRIQEGGDYQGCAGDGPVCTAVTIHQPQVLLNVPVPFGMLGLLGAGALLAMLVAVGAGLLVLRSSTDLDELRMG
jgi:hypothetical protein